MTPSLADSPDLRHVTKRVRSGTAELHAEALLNPASNNPPVILLSEAEAPSSRWAEALVQGLAAYSGGAIWFDTRDCGRSSWVDEPYAMEDLMVDVLMVLDAFEFPIAHVLGRSMGGQIAQQLALAMPNRVASLTLLSTSPGRREELGMPEEWLVDEMTERLFNDPPPDSAGRANWIVEQLEWFSGPVFAFDRVAALLAAAGEVATGWRGANGHGLAVADAPDIVDYLGHIEVPSLVIHGTADPVYPVAHAQALAEHLADARLVLIEGLGHELPEAFVPQLLTLIFDYHGQVLIEPRP